MSAVYLTFRGQVGTAATGTAALTLSCMLALITVRLTAPPARPPWHDVASSSGARLWAQIGLLLVLLALIDQWLLAGHGLVRRNFASLPVWSGSVHSLARFEHAAGIPNGFLVSPVLYAVVPGLGLLALGVRPREVGLARGYRVWRVAALWSAIPLAFVAMELATGRSLLGLLGRTVETTMRSGPFEEFLFRGALFTRLSRALGDGWGITLSSVLFGLLHVGANAVRGDLVNAVAASVLLQGAGSLGLAVVLLRTRNLLAGSITHVLTNVGFG